MGKIDSSKLRKVLEVISREEDKELLVQVAELRRLMCDEFTIAEKIFQQSLTLEEKLAYICVSVINTTIKNGGNVSSEMTTKIHEVAALTLQLMSYEHFMYVYDINNMTGSVILNLKRALIAFLNTVQGCDPVYSSFYRGLVYTMVEGDFKTLLGIEVY